MRRCQTISHPHVLATTITNHYYRVCVRIRVRHSYDDNPDRQSIMANKNHRRSSIIAASNIEGFAATVLINSAF